MARAAAAAFGRRAREGGHDAGLGPGAPAQSRRCREYSRRRPFGGQKKLVELGRALLGGPKLLLLDEPIAGVNPALASELAKRLLAIREQGVTILIIEHNMGFISRICDHVIVLASAKVLVEGTFQQIRENEIVQSAYLGSVR